MQLRNAGQSSDPDVNDSFRSAGTPTMLRADLSCSFAALVSQPEPFGPYGAGLFLG
jgi:hypothetical protein